MSESGSSEKPIDTTTTELKPITIKPEPTIDTEQIKKINDQKTTQAQTDEINKQLVVEKIADITETPDKPKSTKELSTQEQIRVEWAKLDSYFYAHGDKGLEIQKNAWAKAQREEGDSSKYELNAFRLTTAQLEKYAPEKFSKKLDPNKEIEEQKIPGYMLSVRKDGAGADYNPFHKNSWFSKEGRNWELHSLVHHIKPDRLTKPPKAVVKELRDYYTKAKDAEAAKKPA